MLSCFECVFFFFMNSFQYLIMVDFYSKEEANFLIRSNPYFTATRNRPLS